MPVNTNQYPGCRLAYCEESRIPTCESPRAPAFRARATASTPAAGLWKRGERDRPSVLSRRPVPGASGATLGGRWQCVGSGEGCKATRCRHQRCPVAAAVRRRNGEHCAGESDGERDRRADDPTRAHSSLRIDRADSGETYPALEAVLLAGNDWSSATRTAVHCGPAASGLPADASATGRPHVAQKRAPNR